MASLPIPTLVHAKGNTKWLSKFITHQDPQAASFFPGPLRTSLIFTYDTVTEIIQYTTAFVEWKEKSGHCFFTHDKKESQRKEICRYHQLFGFHSFILYDRHPFLLLHKTKRKIVLFRDKNGTNAWY